MIDFGFIGELEGNSATGYVPDARGSNSGVTIGSGFDIGSRSVHEIRNVFEPDLARKLEQFCGVVGIDALNLLIKNPLVLTDEEVMKINQFAKEEATIRLKTEWDLSDSVVAFEDLPDICQTVIASVSFQYGNLSLSTPNFWGQVISLDWDAAIRNLRNFGDRYGTRRNKEADLLQQVFSND